MERLQAGHFVGVTLAIRVKCTVRCNGGPHGPVATVRGGRIRGMTTREKAQKLLDALPEDELEPIIEILASRAKKGTALTPRAAQPKKVGRLSFSGIGASDASDVSERFDEYLGRAIDARHPRS